MYLRMETLTTVFGCFPVFLGNHFDASNGANNKGTSRRFSTILIASYHNIMKYLSLGLLIVTLAVSPPFMDYAASLIKTNTNGYKPFYTLIVFTLISNISTYFIAGYACNHSNSISMKWTQVFQLLTQSKVSTKIDNNPDLIQNLSKYTLKVARNCIVLIIGRTLIVTLILSLLYYNTGATLSFTVYGDNQFIQFTLGLLLNFYMISFTSLDHINSHLFDIMVEYFVQRFRVVNDRIAVIVKAGKREITDQVKLLNETELRSILDEHDLLKVNLKQYDRYWASINIVTLILKPLTCLYCVFQLTFIVQSIESIVFLWLHLIESVYLFTRMFLSGTRVSDEIDAVAANGLRLILFNYSIPVLQRLQLFNQHIMFTEIGFSCGGLFTFTLDSVHDAFIELTQDFLLTLDFVITVRQAKSQLN